jgi:hypothetical protein
MFLALVAYVDDEDGDQNPTQDLVRGSPLYFSGFQSIPRISIGVILHKWAFHVHEPE